MITYKVIEYKTRKELDIPVGSGIIGKRFTYIEPLKPHSTEKEKDWYYAVLMSAKVEDE